MEKYKGSAMTQLNNAGVKDIDVSLLDNLVDRMKNMIDNRDATLVSTSDEKELETVYRNFVKKKLEVDDKERGMKAIHHVADKMKGERNKNRAAFYYMVQKEVKK